MSSIVEAIRSSEDSSLRYSLVHTGQHYDQKLSDVFFRELGLPQPSVNFGVGSASHTIQTARIMEKFEEHLLVEPTDCVVVVGDVNSTMACTLVAAKMGIKVAHVEAGLESGDQSMPEEINRLVTDSVANLLFCTSDFAVANLKRRGRSDSDIFLVGNTMIDTLMRNLDSTIASKGLDLEPGSYAVCTLHRPSSVDQVNELLSLLNTIERNSRVPVYFPLHPRTRKQLGFRSSQFEKIHWLEPLSYRDFLHLQKNAKYVLTDSGGLQEETTFLGIPCLTLRENTERPETVAIGTNELLGRDLEKLADAIGRVEDGNWKKGRRPPHWDGRTGERILKIIVEAFPRKRQSPTDGNHS